MFVSWDRKKDPGRMKDRRAISSSPNKGYEAIDAGNGRKLEAVGPYVLDRPESRAEQTPRLAAKEWEELAHARYEEESKGRKGGWSSAAEIPEEWQVELGTEKVSLNAICELGNSKHFGFFPEQAHNWDLLFERLNGIKDRERPPKALLLFAYTGVASLACRKAGADTFHVEASKRMLTWARKNMEANQLMDIRWVLEDALKFVKREEKRGKEYEAIVLDTPSFGRGPSGEIWKAEELAGDIFERCSSLLSPQEHLLIGNLYSERIDMNEMEASLQGIGTRIGSRAILQDLYIPSREGNSIPGGHCFYLEKGTDPS